MHPTFAASTRPSIPISVKKNTTIPSSPPSPAFPPYLPSSQFLQLCQIAIKNIRIPAVRITIRILPNRLKRPPARNRSRRAPIPRQHQRTIPRKTLRVPRARAPPVVCAVDHRPPGGQGVVLVYKVRDPGDHARGGEPVTCCSGRVVLDV